jgi:hypothetical protein
VQNEEHPRIDDGAESLRAAQYVRMSTDHQKYSIENQAAAIAAYATHRNITIVRTYADYGRSGVRIDGREELQRLIKDVRNHQTDFTLILVYDISRWGRFQDADEAAWFTRKVFQFSERKNPLQATVTPDCLLFSQETADLKIRSLKPAFGPTADRSNTSPSALAQCRNSATERKISRRFSADRVVSVSSPNGTWQRARIQ